MRIEIKQHGIEWFFGDEWDEFACPECNNNNLEDMDFGPVKKIQAGGFSLEFKCMDCGCHAVFYLTAKDIKEREAEEND